MNEQHGKDMYAFCKKIYPYCRSITGAGVRQTLADFREYIEKDAMAHLEIREFASKTEVFDWTVPKEWVIREAYIEDEAGNRIVDMKENNLHVVNYSAPIDQWVTLDELKEHIYTRKDQPELIPYVTSYYEERYGFCMSEKQKNELQAERYHMKIDSELKDGVMQYGEVFIPGESEKEIFFSTYLCHPSMANDNCSGIALAAELIRTVSKQEHRKYSYRFLLIPETIGAIAYLSQDAHLQQLKAKMLAGFCLSCVGDHLNYSMVETRYADTLADRVLKNVLESHTGGNYNCYSFLKRGSDERQYNAPGVELPVVCFCRSKFEEFAEYHTSADNLDFISEEGLAGSYELIRQVIEALEYNERYQVTVLCEPQLGKRGLHATIGQKGVKNAARGVLDFLAYADGKNDLIEISKLIHLPIKDCIEIVKKLQESQLIVALK